MRLTRDSIGSQHQLERAGRLARGEEPYQHGARFHRTHLRTSPVHRRATVLTSFLPCIAGGATSTSLESGVNESGVAGFSTASGHGTGFRRQDGPDGRGRERPVDPPREGGDHRTGEDRASAIQGGGVRYGPTGSQ
ncbi:uncharacterized protein B0H18DRAFT_622672 [Fomitopsis serialis]|uniref:uncharacterized protein n=1 Tax=Fomitopsis serialis TaxID=139415 RepID=UPI00200806A8|nr:uncharacterized protein B0H18DRAFT_622672 [Neoantrodia serialis]KAH9919838.1 hypothetical protein B0H18DRAFT_622672 [Neoantrodia serialis]